MAWQETLKERQALAFATTTTINSGGTASLSTGGINMGTGPRRARAFFLLGTLTGAAAVTIQLMASDAVLGTYSAITNNTTNPTVTGVTTDDSLNCIEIRADQMPAGKPFLKAIATETGAANAVVTILLVGDESQYKPGSEFNNATITNNVVTA